MGTPWMPTPRKEWVKAGDRCYTSANMQGTVMAVAGKSSLPAVWVQWDNGHTGTVTITTVRKVTT